MTDQKQIEEIAKLICRMPKKCDDCWQYECQAKYFAKILYNAGYRKADEVRKETAKEILTTLNKAIFLGYQYDDECTFGRDVWNGLLEKFGVEVEE